MWQAAAADVRVNKHVTMEVKELDLLNKPTLKDTEVTARPLTQHVSGKVRPFQAGMKVIAQATASSTQRHPTCTIRIALFAGDWEGVGRLVTKQRSGATYDLVLSSETLYNLESQEVLLNCLTQASLLLELLLLMTS